MHSRPFLSTGRQIIDTDLLTPCVAGLPIAHDRAPTALRRDELN